MIKLLVDAPFNLKTRTVANLADTDNCSQSESSQQLPGTKKAPTGAFLRLRQRKKYLLLADCSKTFVEFINTTTSLSSFLLTSVEWVTSRTYV